MILRTARAVIRARQFGAFCRSLLPEDRGQLALLAGAYLLYTCGYWPWWSAVPTGYPQELWTGLSRPPLLASPAHLIRYEMALRVWFWLPGAAGFFLFLWGARRGARALLLWVVLPACAGIAGAFAGALVIFDVNQNGLEASIFYAKRFWPLLAELIRRAGTGVHVALAGIALASFAAWRISRGAAALPAGFRPAASSAAADAAADDAPRRFAWLMLALAAPLAAMTIVCGTPLLEWILSLATGRVPAYWITEATEGSTRVLAALPLALLAIWLMGKDRGKELARVLSPWPWKWLLLAPALPALLHWIPKLLFLLGARIHWATFEIHSATPPPETGEYLMPGRWQWDLLRFAAAALLSELAWRGYALRRFVARLGMHRGIVLLGMLWATLFQQGGWYPYMSDAGVLIRLAASLLWGIAVSYLLSWLTLRSGSALPAAAAMAMSWMLPQMSLNEPAPARGWLASSWVTLALWAAAAVILFRYFPPPEEDPKEAAEARFPVSGDAPPPRDAS